MRIARLLFLPLMIPALAAAPASESPTLMTERGKLLFEDSLSTTPGKAWKIAKGQWEPADGALIGTELKSDKHAAVLRHTQTFHNAIIQYSFKLDGARNTTLSVNTAKAHLCRVLILPTGFRVQKDDFDHEGPDKAAILQDVKTPLKAGEWHTLVVELNGKEMLAGLDGQHVAFGSHDALDVDKANFGLTILGGSVAFKELKVWEALPNASWEKTKTELLAKRSNGVANAK